MRSQNFLSNRPLLYLVATPIGNLQDLSPRAKDIIEQADLIACEDTRVSGLLISSLGFKKPLISLREHNEVSEANYVVEQILSGKKVVYMSDAGYPAVSDPGSKLVQIALEHCINVSVIPGPNAGLSALVASGLNTDHFYFHGFLSPKESQRNEELRKLATREETLIFYEAPHRIMKTLESLYEILGSRKACIARELTKKHEEYIRMNLEEMVKLDPETLKGEMVIVVEGCYKEVSDSIDDKEIIKLVNNFESMGVSTKDAIKKVSELTNVSKNYIYKIYHN